MYGTNDYDISIDPGDTVDGAHLEARIEHLTEVTADPELWGEDTCGEAAEELAKLEALKSDLETCGNVRYLSIVHEDKWLDYATQLFDDLHDLGNLSAYVNYEAFADALIPDYTVIEWEGHTYYVQ